MVQYDWNSLEEWAAALCIPRSGYDDVCSKEDEATIAEAFQIYKRKIVDPWTNNWMKFFDLLLKSTRSELLPNSPKKVTKTIPRGDCVFERFETEFDLYWYERPPKCNCNCKSDFARTYCNCCEKKSVKQFRKEIDCTRWWAKSQSELCGESCFVPLFRDPRELLKANGCTARECKEKKIAGFNTPNNFPYQADKHDCGWQCPEGKETRLTYTAMMNPIHEAGIQGFTLAEAIRNRAINIPPYNYRAHKKSSYETSNTCPDGYVTEDNEAVCSSRAHQWCDSGFKHSGEWPTDPAGCFFLGTQQSTCTVWFNKLNSSNPTNPDRWKICRLKASMEDDQ